MAFMTSQSRRGLAILRSKLVMVPVGLLAVMMRCLIVGGHSRQKTVGKMVGGIACSLLITTYAPTAMP